MLYLTARASCQCKMHLIFTEEPSTFYLFMNRSIETLKRYHNWGCIYELVPLFIFFQIRTKIHADHCKIRYLYVQKMYLTARTRCQGKMYNIFTEEPSTFYLFTNRYLRNSIKKNHNWGSIHELVPLFNFYGKTYQHTSRSLQNTVFICIDAVSNSSGSLSA